MSIYIHPTADISPDALIGEGTKLWHQVQIRENARLGEGCILGKGVFIDTGVQIGDHVKIQNYVSIYQGVSLADGVFVGPHVCFTNDLYPRAINPDGTIKAGADWTLSSTRVGNGASIGANSTIRCGIEIGDWAMVGAGSVVTQDVPAYGLVWGNPALLHGFLCPCGTRLERKGEQKVSILTGCPKCKREIQIPRENWQQII